MVYMRALQPLHQLSFYNVPINIIITIYSYKSNIKVHRSGAYQEGYEI